MVRFPEAPFANDAVVPLTVVLDCNVVPDKVTVPAFQFDEVESQIKALPLAGAGDAVLTSDNALMLLLPVKYPPFA